MSVNGVHVFNCAGLEVSAQQHPDAFTFFDKFFTENKFDRIIEIGTAAGGFAWWLHHRTGLPITTYDITVRPHHENLRQVGVNVVHGDVFSPENAQAVETSLQAPGRVLLLCDGGDKIREFNRFAAYLKRDDVIMAHDYSHDRASFRGWTQAKWPWWEIQWADVATVCNVFGLIPADPDSAAALWLSMRKT